MTRLSVNINKVALLRNSRGGNLPDLLQIAKDCEAFGAQGITVHPRPDQRHIRYDDVAALKAIVTTEFNIEGNPIPEFIDLVLASPPHQCTLVPDTPDQLTSDAGWNTVRDGARLREVCSELQRNGIRVSVFVDPVPEMVEGAKAAGADRVEFYTGPFAHDFKKDPTAAVRAYTEAALVANQVGIGINAGHDLNLENLKFFRAHCPQLLEVSIGHALISDALYYGLSNTIRMYLQQLQEV
ncbi:MAG TPA: pyridoxine 5'-phosphate synthase [Saprospiraceae bacterium]|nr:pyridoxine 5'-phosphate synthase [Saprospiraceae bacterium]HPI06337.1 pyridoxine 5'-phosphate synthase [Saprospiraceae bacterium]